MGTHFTLSIAQKASQGEYSLPKGACGNCDAVKKNKEKLDTTTYVCHLPLYNTQRVQ